MERRVDDLERQVKESKRDKDSLMEQIRDFQRQIESQRETVVGRYDKEREIQERMTERNRLLNEALEENKVQEYFIPFSKSIKRLHRVIFVFFFFFNLSKNTNASFSGFHLENFLLFQWNPLV